MGIFASRVAEVPQLLDALWYHPDGMRITDLAAEVDRSPEAVSEALRAYYTADFAAHVADLVFRPEVIEFFGGSEDDDPTTTAPMVRLVAPSPGEELGVAYVSVSELARLYRAGRDQLILEPENAVLASAVDKLHHSLLPGVGAGRTVGTAPPHDVTKAIRKHRRMRVAYARAWKPGVRERVIEPYRLIRTRRGWELDAGPTEADGDIRTYLLSGIQEYGVLAETFEPPADVEAVIRRHRHLSVVELVVAHDFRWAVDKYAEDVRVLEEDETEARLSVSILPPLRLRVGLMLLAGGPRARVLRPEELADAGRELACVLLRHYGEDPPAQ
jgi:predicted DNA-binding transcriptional regulator YafY